MSQPDVSRLLERALQARSALLDPAYTTALRLFNGFYEGEPALVADLFGRSLVLFAHGAPKTLIDAAAAFYRTALTGIQCVVVKDRSIPHPADRRGTLLPGSRPPDTSIQEDGVRYAIDLRMNQDASFYMDTRCVRRWVRKNLAGRSVLNTFAYTGSLGVAARAGGAGRIVHLDRNARFLDLARASYALNGYAESGDDFLADDFFTATSRLRRSAAVFDCVILDPPYFSATPKGQVNLLGEQSRLINKVRPLVADDGWLVAINNALFLSGAEYIRSVEEQCKDGYVRIEALLPVPEEITGYADTIQRQPPVDPAPFNHPTKIALLRIRKGSSE